MGRHNVCFREVVALLFFFSLQNFNWKLSKSVGPTAQYQRAQLHTVSSVLPKPCYNGFAEFPVAFAKADEVGPYLLIEYSAQQLCYQLTLLQQVQRCRFTWKYKYLSSYFILGLLSLPFPNLVSSLFPTIL